MAIQFLGLLALCGPLFAGPATPEERRLVQAAEQDRIAAMAKVAPSVVCIFEDGRAGGGSGVIISPEGYGLTNYHVVAGLMKTRRGTGGLADGKLYPLEVLGIDPTGDQAMFRLSGRERFEPAVLGNSDDVAVGDWVFAMGNPYVLAEDYTPTVTHGIVSGIHRYQFGSGTAQLVYSDCIQVDASINPGNSGGPLFNMQGQLIGINGRASFEHRGRVNVGVGYAITINQFRRFIPGLRAGLLTEHGALGATVMDAGYRRVVFEKMLETSVASRAGIRVGDRLIAFAGLEIESANQFASMLGTYPAGWPVTIEFEHDVQRERRRIRLERLPVKMRAPFEPDARLNRVETRRVLDAAGKALGRPPTGAALTWKSRRETWLVQDRMGSGDVDHLICREPADGPGECQVQADGQPLKTYTYNGRIAHLHGPEGKTVDPTSTEADRFNLWLMVRRVMSAPQDEAWLSRWQHQGGEPFGEQVAELLLYASPDSEDFLVAFNPQSHLPAKAWWKPAGGGSGNRPAVELEFHDYLDIQGLRLPARIEGTIGATGRWSERIEAYAWESKP